MREAILAQIEAGRSTIDPYSADQVGPASICLSLDDEIRIAEASRGAIHRKRSANQSGL